MTYTGTSVREFFDRFPNEDACLRHVFEVKFGDHTPCHHCGVVGRWTPIRGTKKYFHLPCRKHVSPLKDTAIYRSNLSLMAWFYAMLLMTNSSTGVRSSFLRRQMGIGVKSAHALCNKLRLHMASHEVPTPFGGPGRLVHIDEAFIPHMSEGVRQRPHIIMGIASDGKVSSGILSNRKLETLSGVINRLVLPGSIIVTDYHLGYSSLAADGWDHIRINHKRGFHNFAGVTNNPIEGYWATVRRTMSLYQHVAPHNLWRFLAEIQFRFNRRHSVTSTFYELIGSFPIIDPENKVALERNFDWSKQ